MMRHNTICWLGSLVVAVLLAAGCGILRQSSAERRAGEARVAAGAQQLDESSPGEELQIVSVQDSVYVDRTFDTTTR